MITLLALLLLSLGALFFVAGTLGLLRFPDLYCRLHALTKVDNLGLGLTIAGLMLLADSWLLVAKLLLIWLLALLGSASASYLLASRALALRLPLWRRPSPQREEQP